MSRRGQPCAVSCLLCRSSIIPGSRSRFLQLPKFASFECVRYKPSMPSSSLSFHISERVNRVLLWFHENFILDPALQVPPDSMELSFVNIKDGSPLIFRMTPEAGGKVTILCDDMDTVAEIVQELCAKLGVRGRVLSCLSPSWSA